MKLFALLVTVALLGTICSAAEMSCGDMAQYKEKLAAELNWIEDKMKNARSSDELDLYIDQWETASDRYYQVEKTIKDICQN
jgi:hypothetical protein